jgi:hypothetical protein
MIRKVLLLASGIALALCSCEGSQLKPNHNLSAKAVGRIAYGGVPLVSENGGYGVVLLMSGNEERNIEVCDEFRQRSIFKSQSAGKEVIQYTNVDEQLPERPVYWLDSRLSGPADLSDCQFRVRHYNYSQAYSYLVKIGLPPGDGPFLVVWKESGPNQATTKAGVFDLSDTPKSEFRRSIHAFLVYISHAPEAWNPEFYKEATLREQIKKFLDEDLTMVGSLISVAAAASD